MSDDPLPWQKQFLEAASTGKLVVSSRGLGNTQFYNALRAAELDYKNACAETWNRMKQSWLERKNADEQTRDCAPAEG